MKKGFRSKIGSLTFKFTVTFIFFTLLILGISGWMTYQAQVTSYKQQNIENMSHISNQLARDLEKEGETLSGFQDFLVENYSDLEIDPTFTDYRDEKRKFDVAFVEKYTNMSFGDDVPFAGLTGPLKKKCSLYYYEYLQLKLETTSSTFELPNVSYIFPTDNNSKFIHIIDTKREWENTRDGDMMTLCKTTDITDDMKVLLETWESGEEQNDVDLISEEDGRTYSYYMPVKIDGKVVGLVCVKTDVDKIYKEIMDTTVHLIEILGIVLVVSVVLLAILINVLYVSKLVKLNNHVGKYARDKNPDIVAKIEKLSSGNNEISVLSSQIAEMITEIEKHIENITSISSELSTTKEAAQKLSELAQIDNLTGLGNKFAYSEEVSELNDLIGKGSVNFAIAVFDLNNLKKINDTCGHVKGDAALVKLAGYARQAFWNCNIYRIGGDEFAVIMRDEMVEKCDELIENFRGLMKKEKSNQIWVSISAAVGSSAFEAGVDKAVEDVFKRADTAMYDNKAEMKEQMKYY